MFNVSIKVSGNIQIPSMSRLGRAINMAELGQFSLQTVKARIARGVGSDDTPMPPLKQGRGVEFDSRENGRARFRPKQGYAAWKSKHGLEPIRDMMGDGKQGGHMMANFSVRSASDTRFTIAFTQRVARLKAIGNERRTPFLSFSADDERRILAYARQLFATGVEVIRRSSGGAGYGKKIAPGVTWLP
jgi:hypothetical protein